MTCDLNALLLPGEWQTPTFESGWSGSDVAYRLEGDVVRIIGNGSHSALSLGTYTVFFLPVGYQPSEARVISQRREDIHVSHVYVDTNGAVNVVYYDTGSAVNLDGQFVL